MVALLPEKLNKTENWRYSNVKRLGQINWQMVPDHLPRACDMSPMQDFIGLNPITICIEDGKVLNALPHIDGITIERHDKPLNSPCGALGKARQQFFRQGLKIHVHKNHHQDRPLRLLSFLSHPDKDQAFAASLDIDVQLDDGASLTLINQYEGAHGYDNSQYGDYWHLPHWQIALNRDANLTMLTYSPAGQDAGSGRFITTTMRASLQQAASFDHFEYLQDQGTHRIDIGVDLMGDHARANLHGAYLAKGASQIDHQIEVAHLANHGYSQQKFYGIAEDESLAIFQGLIRVGKGATANEAHQSHKAMLLSEKSAVFAKPALVIDNDDVICSHGVSIGDLDPAQLFYLRARGIDEATARTMLLSGFLANALQDEKAQPLLQIVQPATDDGDL